MEKLSNLASIIILILMSLWPDRKAQANEIHLIPYPNQIEVSEGSYRLNTTVTYHVKGKADNEQKHLVRLLEKDLKLGVKKASMKSAVVRLILDAKQYEDYESYTLTVNSNGITIEAPANAGLFYGIQTLRQLIRIGANGDVFVPFVSIKDAPRFKWRAMLLDEARTFQGMKVVKQLIDELSYLKINRLQWHLTDDQGWRIEIKKYPELTWINTPLTLSDDLEKSDDKNAKKGYYTQEEITEVIRYARERHIIIVPEIEMPGHASAAIAAYPWLGAEKSPIEIPVKQKPVKVNSIFLNIFDVSDLRTIKFFRDVLDEVTVLFHPDVIHIGGDEVNFTQWKESAHVQAFMQEKKIESPAALQLWLTNSMSHYLTEKGVRMMGWNDIMGQNLHNYDENHEVDFKLKDQLAPGTIVHFWKGDTELISETAKKGYDVVNAYHIYTYLDYTYQSISIENAYTFEPVPVGLAPELHNKIIGLGCQMWGGSVCTIETTKKLHQQIFPRIAAYAEVGWTLAERKDMERFRNQLSVLTEGWKLRSIGFYDEKN